MKAPWGKMWKLFATRRFWIKLIWAKGRLSLQSHADRTEYHFGFYKVLPHEKHRLQRGIFIEIATGNPREDDITRYEDDYGRI